MSGLDAKPLVTIGICVKNCEQYIEEVIRDIKSQDFPHDLIEIVAVDDGSQDNTFSLTIDLLSETGMKHRAFRTKKKGLSRARNLVVENAEGNYIVWVDGDMTLSKDFIRKQVDFMERNPKVGIAKGKHGLQSKESLPATLEGIYRMVEDSRREGETSTGILGTGGSIYRVKALKQVSGFDAHIRGAGEDIDIENRIKEAGWSLYLTDAVFHERYKKTFRQFWREYVWFGYGMHYVLHKHRALVDVYKFFPAIAFCWGLLYAVDGYTKTRRRVAFLLPLHCTLTMTAWCFGFAKSHFSGYE